MSKVKKFSAVLTYFATQQWKFYNNNTQRLAEQMCKADKKLFNFDIKSLKWDEYFKPYVNGIKYYLLKESPSALEDALKRQRRLRILHYATLTNLFLALFWFIMSRRRKFQFKFLL